MKIDKIHPSYGMLQINKTSINPPINLFGSPIKQSDVISLKISQAQVSRNLNKDYYYEREEVVEIFLSHSQLIKAIISMNSTGTPVTIHSIGDELVQKERITDNTKEVFQREFQDSLDNTLTKARKACETAQELINSKMPFNKEYKQKLKSLLFSVQQDIETNLNYINRSFEEQMENIMLEYQFKDEENINV